MPDPSPASATVRALLETDLVTPATRAALTPRLEVASVTPMFFTAEEFALLEAVSARLVPLDGVNLAAGVDARLARGESKGWRYDTLPPDARMYRLGLCGLEETALEIGGVAFTRLEPDQQDAVLRAIQTGAVTGEVWMQLNAARFFEELLAELTEIAYSLPVALETMGYTGFADAHGWQRIGLNELEGWEAAILETGRHD